MQTVTAPTSASNPKAYHCTYLGLSGMLVKPADTVLFLEPESGAVIALSPEDVLRDVVVNGEVADAMAQYIADLTAGGYAAVACGRAQEVR